MTCSPHIGDSAQGQGCAAPGLPGLSLRLGGIATHPGIGALRTHRALKRLSANGVSPSTNTRPLFCEHACARAENEIARQRGNAVTAGAA